MQRDEDIEHICEPLPAFPDLRLHFAADLPHGHDCQRDHDEYEHRTDDQIQRIRLLEPARDKRDAEPDRMSERQDRRKDRELTAHRHEALHQRGAVRERARPHDDCPACGRKRTLCQLREHILIQERGNACGMQIGDQNRADAQHSRRNIKRCRMRPQRLSVEQHKCQRDRQRDQKQHSIILSHMQKHAPVRSGACLLSNVQKTIRTISLPSSLR